MSGSGIHITGESSKSILQRYNGGVFFNGVSCGAQYIGQCITINADGSVVVDGVKQEDEDVTKFPCIHIEAVSKLGITIKAGDKPIRVEKLHVVGNVEGSINTSGGFVDVQGDVKGDVRSQSGPITAKTIAGSASTMSGDVRADTIGGSASTMSGNVYGNAEKKARKSGGSAMFLNGSIAQNYGTVCIS